MNVFYATASHEKCEVLLYFTTVTKKNQPPHRGLQQVRAVWHAHPGSSSQTCTGLLWVPPEQVRAGAGWASPGRPGLMTLADCAAPGSVG